MISPLDMRIPNFSFVHEHNQNINKLTSKIVTPHVSSILPRPENTFTPERLSEILNHLKTSHECQLLSIIYRPLTDVIVGLYAEAAQNPNADREHLNQLLDQATIYIANLR